MSRRSEDELHDGQNNNDEADKINNVAHEKSLFFCLTERETSGGRD